ncbi:MAG: hypothetical protein ACP5N6_13245 [Anaerolineae bacterium]|jgi:hypothetical protein
MGTKRILTVLLVAMLAVTLFLLLWAWTGGPVAPSPTAPAAPLPTAEEALGSAKEAAHQWRSDAQLVSVSATWNRARRETLLAGPTGWSFVFYSPSAGEIRYVGVGPEGASLGRGFPANTPPETLVEEAWRFRAADVLLFFLASGGERYLRDHPAAAVNLRLGAESGQTVWTVLAVEGDKEPFILRLDARTGERLP